MGSNGADQNFEQICTDCIQGYLEEHNYTSITAKRTESIPLDFTVFPGEASGSLTPYFGYHEADVAVFTTDPGIVEKLMRSDVIQTDNIETFRIPLVAIEIKHGSPGTKDIRAASFVANEMKSYFPLLRFFLAIDESSIKPKKLYRAGKYLDAFFELDETADEQWVRDQVIANGVEPHLQRLAQLGVIGT